MTMKYSIQHKRHPQFNPATALLCAALALAGCSANRDRLKIKTACDISNARPANPNGSVLVAASLTPKLSTPDAPATPQAQPGKPAILFAEPSPGSGPDSPSTSDGKEQIQVSPIEPSAAPLDQPKTGLRESKSADHALLSTIYKGC
jgi:hypothetical protein